MRTQEPGGRTNNTDDYKELRQAYSHRSYSKFLSDNVDDNRARTANNCTETVSRKFNSLGKSASHKFVSAAVLRIDSCYLLGV